MNRATMPALLTLLSAILLMVLPGSTAQAADQPKRELLRSLQQVKPSFQITPIVREFESRRGQLVRFEYTVEAFGSDVTLLVRPVALRQEENGVVLPDDQAPVPGNIQLETPSVIDVKADERLTIKGRLRIPSTNTTFHSFGILVKNSAGKPVDEQPTKPGERRMSIKFVTQYLLRCDVRVLGARGSAVRDLELRSARLVEKNGSAQAQLLVHNPTESPLEFETRCRFHREGGAAPRRTFDLMLPVRSSLPVPERNIARILPKTTVRVENLLPHPVFSGPHQLSVELHTSGRVQQRGEFPIQVLGGKFPAQDASVVRVASEVIVSPSQVELSLQRGGKRFLPLTIENTSLQSVAVHLSHDDSGSTSWLNIRPETLQIGPGKQAKAMVSVQSGFEITRNQYAPLRIDVTPETGTSIGSQSIPVALLARTDEQPDLKASDIRWTDESHRSTLTVTVANHGSRHAALHPRLRLTDSLGRGMELQGGFGKWLLPGSVTQVDFPLVAVPPPGLYRAEVVVDVDPDEAPTMLVADDVLVP